VLLNTVTTGKDTVEKFRIDWFLMCSECCSIFSTNFMENFPEDNVNIQNTFS
jgi:hypothetical protein